MKQYPLEKVYAAVKTASFNIFLSKNDRLLKSTYHCHILGIFSFWMHPCISIGGPVHPSWIHPSVLLSVCPVRLSIQCIRPSSASVRPVRQITHTSHFLMLDSISNHTHTITHSYKPLPNLFRCVLASLKAGLSVRPSVRLSRFRFSRQNSAFPDILFSPSSLPPYYHRNNK